MRIDVGARLLTRLPGRFCQRLCLVSLVAILASGCLESAPEKPPAVTPTPIGALQIEKIVIPREAFCDLVPDAAVEQAVGGEVSESQEWGDGDQPAGSETSGTDEVTHEFGCAWSNDDGVVARAWVFARPVTRQFARQVSRQTSSREDCRTPDGPRFGDPTQLQVCKLGGGVRRVRHAGLFGDAWLTCEVAEPTARMAKLRGKSAAWCVEVVNALDANQR